MQIRTLLFSTCLSLGLSAIMAANAGAQPRTEDPQDDKGFAVGIQFSGLRVNQLKEGAAGFGARTAYDIPLKYSLILSPEIEFNYFPQNPSGNFGESQLLAGTKIGVRRGQFGLFGKVRPGFVHFPGDGDFAARNNGGALNFALDTGVVIEYWPRPRIALRFDVGDTMVYFPSPVNTGVGPAAPASVTHNMQFATGVVFHF